ncbi:MAG TPA: metal-sulfur cluster assembly factor [archaeon]|nr:metal-sulfur cluster assembly factor [archaeon]
MLTREQIIEAIKKVVDPEIRIDVWTLGLIYDLQLKEGGKVHIKMTFTTPYCPYGPQLLSDLKNKVKSIEGVSDVEVELTFDPPWQPSEELKAMLGVQ